MTDVDVEDFLSHHGVKGMRWGVRRSQNAGASAKKLKVSNSKTVLKKEPSKGNLERKKAVKKAVVSVTMDSIAPAAMILGVLGPPTSLALGLSVRVLKEPAVQRAIKNTSTTTASLMAEVGKTKVSTMRKAKAMKKSVVS